MSSTGRRGFCVARTLAQSPALVQKELAGGHRTKIRKGKIPELVLQLGEPTVHPVTLLSAGGGGADTR